MNKLMLTYLVVDFLFLACGGLLLGFSLISEQQERAAPTVSNVPYMLLLSECPLTGTATKVFYVVISGLIRCPSRHCECHFRLLHFPHLPAGPRPTDEPWLAQAAGLACRYMLRLLPYSWPGHLVRDITDAQEPEHNMGNAIFKCAGPTTNTGMVL